MKWEYKLVGLEGFGNEVEHRLNQLGEQGFHLITTIQPTCNRHGLVILERGVNPEWDKVAAEFNQQKVAADANPVPGADWEG